MIRPDRTPQARALEQARRRILEHVADRESVPIAEIPVRWPLTRHHARLVIRDLSRDGLVAFARRVADRRPVLTLTKAGRAAVGPTPGADEGS